MHQGTCAHGARFNCSKELAVSQTVIAQVGARLPQGDNFRVGGGIGIGEVAIPASANDLAGTNYDRPDGNFARFQATLGGTEGFLHPKFVRDGRWALVVGH